MRCRTTTRGLPMLRTAATCSILWILISALPAPTRADRPGSYDNVIGGAARRSPSAHPARPGTALRGHGHQQGHSSIYLGVGIPFGCVTPPIVSYGAYYPSWSFSAWTTPYGMYYNPALNYGEYYLPPTYVPAELYYGPQAIDRFLGAQRTPVAAPVAPAAAGAVEPAGIADKLRKSNAETRERARRFLQFGDALFLKQRFHEAAQRYRSAIEVAPDLPEAYYRQAFALLTVKQYRLAAKALRIAVELDPDMLRSDKLVQTLYGDNRLVKESHLEQLASAAINAPENGDLLFLLGGFLYANDEPEQGVRFLRKAHEIADPKPVFLAPLLKPVRSVRMEFDT